MYDEICHGFAHKQDGDSFRYDRDMRSHVESKRFWADFDDLDIPSWR